MSKRSSWLPLFLSYFFISLLLLLLSISTRLPFVYGLSEIVLHPLRVSSYGFLTSFRSDGDTQVQRENVVLRSELAKMYELQKDDAALRDQFQTTSIAASKLLPARILSERTFIPGVSLPETLVIDRGSSDGITKGQAAVVKDNLIGIVSTVSQHASVVILVTSTQTSLTSVTAKTNATGIVKGHGKGSMTFENVLLSDSLQTGDMVVTKGESDSSGIGTPPNLIIGKISAVHRQSSNLFQNAELVSPINITKLTMVFIYK